MDMKHLLTADGSDFLLGEGVQPKLQQWSLGLGPSVSCAVELGVWLKGPHPHNIPRWAK